MKKTIFALFALSSVAMGLTLEDAKLTASGNNSIDATGDDVKSTQMTVVITLNVQTLKKLLESSPESSLGYSIVKLADDTTADFTGVCINTKNSDYGLWGVWTNNPTYTNMDGGTNAFADLNGEAEGTGWGNVAYAGLTYSHSLLSSNVSHTYAALVLYDTNGNKLSATYADANGLGSRIFSGCTFEFGDVVTASYYFNEAVTEESAMQTLARAASVAPTIPEPTTATLSLLALAGLAARRRRK